MKIAQVPGDQIPLSEKLLSSPYSIPLVSYLLSEELVRRGHEVFVFAPIDSKTNAKVMPDWLSSKDPRFKLKGEKRFKVFEQYCEYVRKEAKNFDIIHVHDIYLRAFDLLKGLETPVIGTFHNPKFYKKDKKRYEKVMFVGISKSQIKNNPGFNFVGQVYNGIWVEKFPFNDKPKEYLLWLGRISPEKGALEAEKIATKIGKKLIMIGPPQPQHPAYVKKVKEFAKKHKNIEILGPIYDFKEKTEYLKNALCLLMPLKWEEPFGIVMVEAMACGTPVIAYKRGAAKELVKDKKTGFLVEGFWEAIKAIKKIDQISRKKCREWVEENFTAEKMAQGYEKIYQKVIEKWKKRK